MRIRCGFQKIKYPYGEWVYKRLWWENCTYCGDLLIGEMGWYKTQINEEFCCTTCDIKGKKKK